MQQQWSGQGVVVVARLRAAFASDLDFRDATLNIDVRANAEPRAILCSDPAPPGRVELGRKRMGLIPSRVY